MCAVHADFLLRHDVQHVLRHRVAEGMALQETFNLLDHRVALPVAGLLGHAGDVKVRGVCQAR